MLVLQHCRCRISESHHLQVSAELQGVCVHHGDCPLINKQTVMQKFLTWEAWWRVAVDVYIRHSPLSWATIDQAIRALVCLTHGRRSRFAKLWTFISCNYRNVLLMSKILLFIVKGNHTNSAPRAWIGCLGLRASHSFDQTKHFCGRYKFYDVVLFGALTTTTKPSQKKIIPFWHHGLCEGIKFNYLWLCGRQSHNCVSNCFRKPRSSMIFKQRRWSYHSQSTELISIRKYVWYSRQNDIAIIRESGRALELIQCLFAYYSHAVFPTLFVVGTDE